MPKTNANPAALRRILQQELEAGKRLLALSIEETDVLINNNVERLAILQREQQRFLAEHQALEKARVDIVRDLAWMLGMDRVPTLSGLLPALPRHEQAALGKLRAQLLDLQAQIELIHARNRRLIENALDYIQFSLKMLTTAALQPARYGTNIARIANPAFYIDSKA